MTEYERLVAGLNAISEFVVNHYRYYKIKSSIHLFRNHISIRFYLPPDHLEQAIEVRLTYADIASTETARDYVVARLAACLESAKWHNTSSTSPTS